MAWKSPMIAKENGQVDYSAKRSAGTQWAIDHVARTYKRRDENGKLVMLTPPPLVWKDRHAK